MGIVSAIAEIIRDLLIFVVLMFAMLLALIVVVSKMPDVNPLKRVLTALCYRLGATTAAGVVAIPVEPIPGLDALYDLAVPLALIWYWFTFFRDAARMVLSSSFPPLPETGLQRDASERSSNYLHRFRRDRDISTPNVEGFRHGCDYE